MMKNLQDVKVIPGEECFSQHRLLVTVLKWQDENVTQKKTGGRVKLWRFKDEKIRKVVRQRIDEASTGCKTWNDWSHNLLRAATSVCGRSRDGQRKK